MTSKREIWRSIDRPAVPTYYQVSNMGRVRALPYTDRRGHRRNLRILTCPNAEVALCLDTGAKRWFPVAQLVLYAFVGPPGKDQYLARHLDDDRSNNFVVNLAWGNDQDNHDDAIRNGVSFVSYGHLGKPHSEKTKQVLRLQRLGKPTGHKMTDEHKAAMLSGYWLKFPEKRVGN